MRKIAQLNEHRCELDVTLNGSDEHVWACSVCAETCSDMLGDSALIVWKDAVFVLNGTSVSLLLIDFLAFMGFLIPVRATQSTC